MHTICKLSQTETWVSRSAHKLAHGLDVFGIDPDGRVCVDIGASTGDFTQVLLSRGAVDVHAVDVGHDQINPAIRDDPRVVSMEGVNAKQLTLEQIDPLAETGTVVAVEGDRAALDALQKGANHTQGLKAIAPVRRDLFADPLAPLELKIRGGIVWPAARGCGCPGRRTGRQHGATGRWRFLQSGRLCPRCPSAGRWRIRFDADDLGWPVCLVTPH